MTSAVLAGFVLGLAGCSAGSTGGSPSAAARPDASAGSAAGNRAGGGGAAGTSAGTRIPAGHAPTRRFPVARRVVVYTHGADRRLPTTVWYPAAGTGRAAAAPGRFPVVLFSHGLEGLPSDFGTLLSGWAAAGFVVVAPTYPFTSRGAPALQLGDLLNQPGDASAVLGAVLADPRFAAHVDPRRIAAAGHSAGGITTVGLFTVDRDPRLDAGLVLAGSALGFGTAFAGSPVPLLFVHGDADQLVPLSAARNAFDDVPWPKAFLTLPGQGHADPYLHPDTAAFATVSAVSTDFLRWSLYGDAAAGRRLPRDAARIGSGGRLDNRLGTR